MTKKGGRNIPTTTSKKVKYYDNLYQSEYWEALKEKNDEDTATLSVMVRIAIIAIALSILVNSLF